MLGSRRGTCVSLSPDNLFIEGFYLLSIATNVHFYKVDITSPSTIASAATTLRAQDGHPTILINNAGIAYANSILCSNEEEIRRTLEVNTLSHFWTIREFLPHMLEMNHGHIVTMASMASFAGAGGLMAYSASKAALNMLVSKTCSRGR